MTEAFETGTEEEVGLDGERFRKRHASTRMDANRRMRAAFSRFKFKKQFPQNHSIAFTLLQLKENSISVAMNMAGYNLKCCSKLTHYLLMIFMIQDRRL